MNGIASFLGTEHPSYGCEQAWFLFSVRDAGRVARLLLVEAKNPWAVQAIERIAGPDGMVSGNCELLTVHRQCPSIGIRSDLVSEVDYVDFMVDVVDPGMIAGDQWAAAAFQRSLSPEDRERALRKMDRAAPAKASALMAAVIPIRRAAGPDNYQDVLAALTDLGYKRPQAKRAVDALGPRVNAMPLEDAVKAALQGCAGV